MPSSFDGFSAYFRTGYGLGFFFFVFFNLLIDGLKFQNRCLLLKGQSLIFYFLFFIFMKILKILCNLTKSTKLTWKLRRVSQVHALYCIWYRSHRDKCRGGYNSAESHQTRPILWTLTKLQSTYGLLKIHGTNI